MTIPVYNSEDRLVGLLNVEAQGRRTIMLSKLRLSTLPALLDEALPGSTRLDDEAAGQIDIHLFERRMCISDMEMAEAGSKAGIFPRSAKDALFIAQAIADARGDFISDNASVCRDESSCHTVFSWHCVKCNPEDLEALFDFDQFEPL